MSIKKALMVGGAVTALTLGSAAAYDALAQKGNVLQPQSSWSIKNVNDRGDNSYCALARRFDGNVILTLAKNKKAEISLAFDFASTQFNPERLSRVVLDPGSGEQRSFNMKPASDKAYVVKLGRDDAFYNALTRTGYLRLEINQTIYNFNLADIDSGKSQLGSCMGTPVRQANTSPLPPLDSPVIAQPARATLPSSSLSSSSGAVSSSAIAQLNQKIESLEKENARLRSSQAARAAVPDLTDEVEELRAENRGLNQNLQTALRELDKALASQPVSEAGTSSSEDMGVLKAEIETLRSENQKLVSQASEARNALQEMKVAASESLKDIRQNQNEIIASLQQENKNLASQLSQVETQAGDSQGAQDEYYAQKIAGLERTVKEQNALARDYAAQLQTLQQELTGIQREYSRTSKEDLEAEQQLRADLARLKEENSVLQDRLSRENAQMMLAQDSQLESMRAQMLELEEQLAAKDNTIKRLGAVQGQFEALRAEKKELEIVLAEIAQQAREDAQELGAQKNLEQRLALLEQENAALQSALDAREAEEMEVAVQAVEDSQALARMREDYAALQEKYEMQSFSVGEAETIISGLMEEKNALEDALEIEKARQTEVADVKDALKNVKSESLEIVQEFKAASENLDVLTQENAKLSEQNEMLQNQIKSLQTDLASAQEQIAAYADERGDFEKTIANLSHDLASEKEANEALSLNSIQLEQADERIQILQAHNEKLQQELALVKGQAEAQAELYAQKADVLQNDYEALRAELATAQAIAEEKGDDSEQLKAVRAQFETLQYAYQEQSEDLNALMKQYEGVQSKLSMSEQSYTEVQNEAEELRTRNAEILQNLEEEQSLYQDLVKRADELADAQQKLASVEEALQSVKEENAKLRDDADQIAAKIEEEKEAEILALREQVAALETSNDDLAQLVEDEQARAKEQMALLQEKDQKLAEFESQLAEYAGQSDQKAERIAALEEQVSTLESEENIQDVAAVDESVVPDQQDTPALDITERKSVQDLSAQPSRDIGRVEAVKVAESSGEELEKTRAEDTAVAAPMPLSKPQRLAKADEVPVSSPSQAVDDDNLEILAMIEPAGSEQEGPADTQSAQQETVGEIPSHESVAVVEREEQPKVAYDDNLSEAQRMEAAMFGAQRDSASQAAPVSEVNRSGEDALDNVPAQPIEAPSSAEMQPAIADASAAVKERKVDADHDAFQPSVYVESLLKQAGIPLSGSVTPVDASVSRDLRAFQWRSQDDLYGSAHQKPISDPAQFDTYVENYLATTEERCMGDFAIEPALTQQIGAMRIDGYEIACMDENIDSTASLLFFNRDGTFTVLAHETPSSSMAQAMDYRDRIIQTIKNS